MKRRNYFHQENNPTWVQQNGSCKEQLREEEKLSAINSGDLRLHHQYSQRIHAVGFQKHDSRTLRKIQILS